MPGTTRPSRSTLGDRPSVVLHIGEPKTGTTFLQQVMWRNREMLAREGVQLAGHVHHDHFRAVQDLREVAKLDSDPAAPWDGEWDVLAAQAASADRVGVISHELLAACTPSQVQRAARSFGDREVHVLLTVRDMASLLPAEWQETVKHRNTRAWPDWLADVIDTESVLPDRRDYWFWRVHDTVAILEDWAAHIPSSRIHVLTVPPRSADRGVLWQRAARLLGVRPDGAQLGGVRSNGSLGTAETEFLRRLNAAIGDEIPGWFYMAQVKERLAHRALAGTGSTRLSLPDSRRDWAADHAELLVKQLGDAGYDIVGDLAELRPSRERQGVPDNVAVSEVDVAAAGVAAVAELIQDRYRHRRGAGARGGLPEPRQRSRRGLIGLVERSPRLRRGLRAAAARYPGLARARILLWRVVERPGHRR